MIDAILEIGRNTHSRRRLLPRMAKPRPSILEKITPEKLHTLRLDEASSTEFEICIKRFVQSKADALAFDGEHGTSMDDARYDQRSSAEEQLHSNGMAVVHFLAPRIMRLREGTAKRKWRSFLTKFRKEEKLN